MLFGAIVPLDLRLAGWRRDAVAVDSLSRLLLPVALAGLTLTVFAGLLLFATDARAYAASWLFRAKVVLIALALGNAILLRKADWRQVRGRRVALAGLASIALWLSVIVCGRLLGYLE